jgi:hypothetical protein
MMTNQLNSKVVVFVNLNLSYFLYRIEEGGADIKAYNNIMDSGSEALDRRRQTFTEFQSFCVWNNY